MTPDTAPRRRWLRYLSFVTSAMICFGGVLVVLPQLTQALFGWMVFGGSGFPSTFSAEALHYVRLAHAVIGAVMVGWFSTVLWLVRTALARGLPGAWQALTLSLLAWFVLDTSFSLLTSFWQNAALNTAILLAFLPGLAGARPRRTPGPARATPADHSHRLASGIPTGTP